MFDHATVQNGAGSGLTGCNTLLNSSIGHSVLCSMLLGGEAKGDYRFIPKVSKQQRGLLKCNNQFRLWVIYIL